MSARTGIVVSWAPYILAMGLSKNLFRNSRSLHIVLGCRYVDRSDHNSAIFLNTAIILSHAHAYAHAHAYDHDRVLMNLMIMIMIIIIIMIMWNDHGSFRTLA